MPCWMWVLKKALYNLGMGTSIHLDVPWILSSQKG